MKVKRIWNFCDVHSEKITGWNTQKWNEIIWDNILSLIVSSSGGCKGEGAVCGGIDGVVRGFGFVSPVESHNKNDVIVASL